MAEETMMVRVKVTTRDRLRAVCQRMAEAATEGHKTACPVDPEPINPRCAGISFDALINRLLDHYQRWQDRKEKDRKKKQGQGGAGEDRGETPLSRFHATWCQLAELGVCDAPGGAEYDRVLTSWWEDNCPDPEGYIIGAANRPAR